MRWLALIAVLGWSLHGPAAAQTMSRPTKDTLACQNARAVRALTNGTDPRRFDPGWVNFVITDGRCMTLSISNTVSPIEVEGELTRVNVSTSNGTLQLFVHTSDLADVTPAPLNAPAIGAAGAFLADRYGFHAADAPSPGATPAASSPFEEGMSDRAEWEGWVTALTTDVRRGVESWASRRSLSNPAPCGSSSNVPSEQDFDFGCRQARLKLAAIDSKRRADPSYRQGWNVYPPPPQPTITAQPPLEIRPAVDVTPPTASMPSPAIEASPPQPPPPVAAIDSPSSDSSHRKTDSGGISILWIVGAVIIVVFTSRSLSGKSKDVQSSSSSSGVLVGILGCVFGVLGIFTIGIVFVPLAALCTIIGLLGGVVGGSFTGIFVSLISLSLTVVAVIASPSLWILFGAAAIAANH